MAELRIYPRRQGLFEAVDFFRNLAETLHVMSGVTAALIVGNDDKAFAEGGGELG